MQIPVPAYRCPLGPMQPERPDREAVKREGWQSQRILVVCEDDRRLDVSERFAEAAETARRLPGYGGPSPGVASPNSPN